MKEKEVSDVVYIYGLVDPTTMQIFYIGKSTNPLQRLKHHISKRSLKTDSPKNLRIRTILKSDLKPILVILQKTTESTWAEAERAWIVQGRMIGWPITNTSDGGEGVLDRTPETPTIRYKKRTVSKSKLVPKKYKSK